MARAFALQRFKARLRALPCLRLAFAVQVAFLGLCFGLAVAVPVPHDAAALAEAVIGHEVDYDVGLPGEGAETEVFFSDLGHGYVTVNAEYTT